MNYILEEKYKKSADILRIAADISAEYYHKPLILTYSGGKDSDVMLQIAQENLEPNEFEVFNSHTTVDAPETVYYIRDKFKELNEKGIKTTIHYSHHKDGRFKSMWSLIEEKQTPPTRLFRYCCAELKETSTPNRIVALGVRRSESKMRKGRDSFGPRAKSKKDARWYSIEHTKEVFADDKARREHEGIDANEEGVYDCQLITNAKKNNDLVCNPIYEWEDNEIWEFIHERKMKYNPLYDKGYFRVGCIGCPLSASMQVRGLEEYPKYKQNYINAFDRMLEKRRAAGKDDVTSKDGIHKWTNGEAVYRWWLNDTSIEGQMDIFDYIKENEDE